MTLLGALASNVEIDTGIADQTITSRKINLDKADDTIATNETTTSTSYTNLATVGPTVTLTPGVTQDQILVVSATGTNTVNNYWLMAPSVNGAAATDTLGIQQAVGIEIKLSRTQILSSIPSGASTVAKYRVTASTANFAQRYYAVVGI